MPFFSNANYLKRALRTLIGSFVETNCVGCDSKGSRLCLSCALNMPKTRQKCIGCKQYNTDGMTCWKCSSQWHIHRVLAATSYRNSLAKRTIKLMKYQYDRSLVRPLALRMLTALHNAQLPHNPLFVPVPLHAQRKRWRGFNQAAYLAQAASDVGLLGYAEPLKRIRNTSPQTKTSGRAERLYALSGAFEVIDQGIIRNRHIILVDDVCTTGATLNACAEVLLKSDARSVTGLVIARV